MHTRTQKTLYQINFVCHNNNTEHFAFLDLPLKSFEGASFWVQKGLLAAMFGEIVKRTI
jgi:hypothetical protein